MSCSEFQESLYDYAQRELEVTLHVTCEQHLMLCRDCVVVMESYRATITFGKAMKCTKPLSAEFETKLRNMLARS